MALTTGINHVAIMTADLDRFVDFYREVFEAELLFQEANPAFRHAVLAVGGCGILHPVEVAGNAHGKGSPAMTDRGHLDHLALDTPSRATFDELRGRLEERGCTDGVVSDLGPKLSFWFVDPDGMHVEVDWVHDHSLAGLHAPQPVDMSRSDSS
ncbi:VOC family protein [Pseudonocardia sp.]|uniref:VOC family protein n=1 Tax=Pseudonocardia sp. TaxID=60912 RepID=UPI003D0E3970